MKLNIDVLHIFDLSKGIISRICNAFLSQNLKANQKKKKKEYNYFVSFYAYLKSYSG